ncbi:MAG: nucleotidyl transferase AbiEii/AbiGii toxin family protein [Kofleriaceae bacterium]
MSLFFEDALLLLRDGGVRFVVVGGTAVILHGVPRTTADLDLVVDLEPSNLRLLVSAMRRLGYHPRAPVDPDGLSDPEQRRIWVDEKGMRAFTFVLPGHPLSDIDVLIDSPISFAELASRAERVDAGGLRLLIASATDLIQMKLAAGRDQDLADVDALRRLLGDAK